MIPLMTFLAIFAGLMFAAQGPVNTALAGITDTLEATTVSFFGGMVILIPVMIFFGSGRLGNIVNAEPWQLIGGMMGVVGVCTIVACMPVIGAAQTVTAIMLGQLIMSAVIDAFGLFGTDVIRISALRVIGIITVAAGIILVYFGNRETDKKDIPEGQVTDPGKSAVYTVIAFASGLITAMQSPVNASLSGVIGSWEGTFVSFVVGFFTVFVITAVTHKGKFKPLKVKGFRPWMCMGGPLGVVGIFFSLYTVFTLGSALQVACGMVGQLAGAVIVDCFGIIVPRVKINGLRAIGIAVIAAGVAVVTAARI